MDRIDFRNPDKTFRTAPFWSWNGTMEPAEVKRQIKLMHEQGFGGYFMHSRVGLETPYMSDAWMSAIAAGIESAQELDMEAWFYDEDKWPSGYAGGMVPALGDDYRNKGLETFLGDANTIAEVWANPGTGVKPDALRVMYRLYLEGETLKDFTRLSAPPAATNEGTYMLCQMRVSPSDFARYNGESYVDLMDRKVTEAFIECTHEAYKERFGAFFGPNVPGIFTDEPNIAPATGSIQTSWTPLLPVRFQELWSYDIADRLPLLFFQGEGCRQVRHDYWATIAILFRDNYTKPFSEWCERNGQIMTGHYLREDNLVLQATHLGAAMPHYVYQQLPGIDHLSRNIKNPLTLKQVSSVAHQMGHKRVLCELFGKAGHSMSFTDQKWMSDFHFALGINFINQHLTLYSMLGERKRDYPANISWAQPYWQDYHVYNNYAARCSWFTQRGDYRADILLLHPIGTLWSILPGKSDEPFYPSYQEQLAAAYAFNDKFLTVFNALLADHRDFDLGDELVMADYARVEGTEICVGGMRYKTVVLPYCSVLEPKTAELLRDFIKAGGRVYLVGDNTLTAEVAGLEFTADAPSLLTVLENDLSRLVDITDETGKQAAGILYQQRADADRQYYFLANTNMHQGATLRVQVAATGTVTVFDPTSGDIAEVRPGERSPFMWADVKVLDNTSGSVILEWQVPGAGSLLFSVGSVLDAESETAPPSYCTNPPQDVEMTATLNGPWHFSRLHPNVLTLDFCRSAIDGRPMDAEARPTPFVRRDVMAACGRTEAIQPYCYITGQVPSRPVPVQLQFSFVIETIPVELALVLEKPDRTQVAVNGQTANQRAVNGDGTDLAFAWLGDPGFGAIDIRSFVHEGENRITLAFTAAADGAGVEEIYLLGGFGVWNQNGRFVIGNEPQTLAPGSWVDQGYPFYTGTMRYQLQLEGTHRWLDLSSAAASVLRVSVNGGDQRLLPWQPWIVDLGTDLAPGANTVEVDVVSTLRNGFGPLHNKRGDIPDVRPVDFRDVTNWTDDYSFVAYGLMGPVKLG